MSTQIRLIIACLFLVMLALGCNTQRRAITKIQKLQRNFPELFATDSTAITTDTVYRDLVRKIYLQGEEIDTTFVSVLTSLIDSFEVQKGRLQAKVKVLESRELGTRTIEVYVRSKPDTIRDTIRIPEILIREKPVPSLCEVVSNSGWPWWWMVVSAVVTGLLTYFVGPRVASWVKTIRKDVERKKPVS